MEKITLDFEKAIVVDRSDEEEPFKVIWMEDIVINIMEMEVDSRCKDIYYKRIVNIKVVQKNNKEN